MNFPKCIDKCAKLHMYVHSMRVTEHDPNLNYDLDDNMSVNFSMNSGNGFQSEYNYPDSMCGSVNGDKTPAQHSVLRGRSPAESMLDAVSPKSSVRLVKQGSHLKSRPSKERGKGTFKVSIDILSNTVKNSLGMK